MFQLYFQKNDHLLNRFSSDKNRRNKSSYNNYNNNKAIIIQEKHANKSASQPRVPFKSIENTFSHKSNESYEYSRSSSSKRFIITEKLAKKSEQISEYETSDDDDDESWHKELTEDDMEFLINNTGFQSDQIRRWHSEFMEKCSTGLITNEQFKAYYRVLLPKDLNEKSKEEIIEKLFCLFDIDGDGCLSFTEFLISFWLRCKAPIKEKYTWIFNMLDEDRNGYLNYSELRNALTLCLNLNDLDELLEVLNKERNNLMKSQSFERKFQQQQQYAHKSSESSESSTDDFTDYNSDDFDSESSDSFLYIGSMATKAPQNSKRKYDLYSRTAQLVDDKLNETVHLLHAISCSFDHKLLSNNSYSSNTSSSFSFFRKSHSTDSLDSLENQSTATNSCANENSGVQIKRENFLKLCEKYKLFRKLLLPIKYFYEENLFMD